MLIIVLTCVSHAGRAYHPMVCVDWRTLLIEKLNNGRIEYVIPLYFIVLILFP